MNPKKTVGILLQVSVYDVTGEKRGSKETEDLLWGCLGINGTRQIS